MSIIRELITRWTFEVDQAPLKRMNESIDNLKSDLFKVGVALAGAGAAIGFFAKKAGNMEQAEIAFETMLGSVEKAKILLGEITKFAQTTPFQLTELVDTSKKLLAFGFAANDVIPVLTTLGNISAGVGKDKLPQLLLAFGQVRAATRLTGMELRQFTEAGVPLLGELAKQLNVSEAQVQQMVSNGAVSFGMVKQALDGLASGGGRFNNLMAKQSKTLLGQWSNLVDLLEITSIEIGKQLIPVLLPLIKQFSAFVTQNKDLIKTRTVEFLKAILNIAIPLGQKLLGIASALFQVADSFGGVEKTVRGLVYLFSALFAVRTLKNIGGLAMGIGGLAKKMGIFTTALRMFNSAGAVFYAFITNRFAQGFRIAFLAMRGFALSTAALPVLIGAAIAALLLIGEDILAFTQGRESFTGDLINGFKKLMPIINKFADQMAGWLQKGLGTAIDVLFGAMFDKITMFGEQIAAAIKAPVAQLVTWIEEKLSFINTFAKAVSSATSTTSKGIANGISNTAQPAVDYLNNLSKNLSKSSTEFLNNIGLGNKKNPPTNPIGPQGSLGPTLNGLGNMYNNGMPLQSAPSAQGMGTTTNTSSMKQEVSVNMPINVTVPAGSDGNAIAQRIKEEGKKGMSEVLRTASIATQPQVAY